MLASLDTYANVVEPVLHLIGGHGDYVWETGKFSNPPETGLTVEAIKQIKHGKLYLIPASTQT